MRKKNFFLLLVTLCLCIFAQAQMLSVYELSSPNGQLVLTVENGRVLQYSLSLEGRSVIHPSAICMTMQNGNIWGKNCLLYTSPSPRDTERSRMPSSA